MGGEGDLVNALWKTVTVPEIAWRNGRVTKSGVGEPEKNR